MCVPHAWIIDDLTDYYFVITAKDIAAAELRLSANAYREL